MNVLAESIDAGITVMNASACIRSRNEEAAERILLMGLRQMNEQQLTNVEHKVSAIYDQVLEIHKKLNDALARLATLEREHQGPPSPTQIHVSDNPNA